MNTSGLPLKRIVLAITLSLLAHSLLLWQWPTSDLLNKATIPPLQAKLVALPKAAKKSERRTPKIRPAHPGQATTPPVSTPAITEVVAIPTVETTVAAIPDTNTSPPRLPKHAQLTFAVHYGSDGFKVGEVKHVLENQDGRYSLRAEMQTTGLVSLFRNFYLKQSSSGRVTQQGLYPENYVEDKTDGSGKQTSSAHFDWVNHKIRFANGSSKPLLEQAQDILSLSYHLSQLPLNLETFPITSSNGKSISQYFIAVDKETLLDTSIGELRALPLHKVQSRNEDGLIIWLALEYRLLPVKIMYLDKSGEISATMLITDIRVSDE